MRCRAALIRRQKMGLVSIRPTEWQRADDLILHFSVAAGQSQRQIARELGFSLGSVQSRPRRLGIKWPRRPGQPQ